MMKKSILFNLILISLIFIGCTIGENTSIKIELKPGIDTIEINSDYVDPGVKATFGLLTLDATVVSSNLNTQMLGTYTIEYVASYNGMEKAILRYITVIDDTAPSLSLNPGIDTVLVGDVWTDGGVTIIDNSNAELQAAIIGFVDTQNVGDYEITYLATDPSHNQSTITRIVHVIDENE